MKNNNLVWMLVIVLVLVVGSAIAMQINTATKDTNRFTDAENGVSFTYPSHWETREAGGQTLFAVNFDYLDGLAESSSSTEKEGTIIYFVTSAAPTTVDELQRVGDEGYQNCLTEFENSQQELGPFCTKTDYSEWTKTTVNGYTALSHDWRGAPESGEIVKQFMVFVDDKKLIVNIMAVKTGVTDEAVIEEVWEQVLETLKVE